MRQNRFFISPSDIQLDQVLLSGQQAHQIRSVLRLKVGHNIIVLDNAGYEYEVTLTKVTKDQAAAKILKKRTATGEPRTQITLYQALLAREKFEHVLQKCTELGVAEFVPVITERTIVRDAEKIDRRKLARWRQIITEAAEQCERGRIPQVQSAHRFNNIVPNLDKQHLSLIASPKGKSLREVLQQGDIGTTHINLFIGPEGGFTEAELKACYEAGAKQIDLGERILRTETAAVVTSAIILYELQELEP
jgi:16S rRNA (uracil1498-N3)-methyltransferase